MSDLKPTEEKFEDHIEKHLNSIDYKSHHFSEYNRSLCLIRNELLEFIKTTQPNDWNKLEEIHGIDTENKVFSRISSEISKRGIIDVLRNPVVDRGVYLDLCFFQPKSDLNPDHQELYKLNSFTVIRQLHYSNQNENSIDMVLFLNGLPLITMELKNQLTGQNIIHSENQYRNDRDPREPLLRFKRCVVHFCVDNDAVSMTTRLEGKKTRFLPYNRDLENPPVESGYRTKYLWENILPPDSILDILENFVHVSPEKKYFFNEKKQKVDTKTSEVLIFPRYHQLDLIKKFREQIKKDGTGGNYLVQHTTGSGKSYSIGWLAHTLTSLYRFEGDKKRLFDTVVVVTDRKVLDDQLRNTIQSLEQVTGVVGGVEKDSAQLKAFLEQGKDIVISTIQKFPFISETISQLGHKTFAVIIDEVHSSQSGELSKDLKKALSKTDDDDEFDYEEMLRQEIKNRGRQEHISFFGFTGTPKDKTLELFGTRTEDGKFVPFHIYSMYQSIHEGFTLDVLCNYTTYRRYFKIRQTRNDEIEIPVSEGKKELVRYVDSHEQTIRYKVNIMLDHWISKGSRQIQGRARGMIVTRSREHCVLYFREVNTQLKERGINYRALVAFSGEVTVDGEKHTEHGLNQTVDHRGDIPLGLKNPGFRLLIVANKFQTGFDEPLVQSMYVDKILGGVQCVQTLSRLNRTASGKTETFVLDFVNAPEDIRNSFQTFYQSTMLEGETDPNRLYDTQRRIYDFHLYTSEDVKRFCEVFYDRNRDEGDLHPVLDRVVDQFKKIEDVDIREDFRSRIQSFIRMYGYLSQIISFSDIELEKSFVFFKYLNKKLPKRELQRFDISDTVDLDSLRVQKTHERIGELERADASLTPPEFEGGAASEPELDLLSEIITQVNRVHGVNLTEEDRLDLFRLRKRLNDDAEVAKYMNEDNTEENKKNFFAKQFDSMLIDYVNERFDFYKKVGENQSIKDMICQMLYSGYQQDRPLMVLGDSE